LALTARSDNGDNKEMRRRVEVICPVYDWLYDSLSSGERTTLRSELSRLATALDGLVREDEYAVGHSSGNQSRAFLAALAIYGEVSSGATLVNRALGRYHNGHWPFWREHGSEDGGSYKSAWYTTVATAFNHEVFAAWKSATGQNLFKSETWFAGLGTGTSTRRAETSRTPATAITSTWAGSWSRTATFSSTWRGSTATRRPNGSPTGSGCRPGLGAADRLGNPLVRPFRGVEGSYEAALAILQGCRHGLHARVMEGRRDPRELPRRPYYMNSHTHLDQCSFSIEYRGGQALDAGLYDEYDSSHWRNYYSRTIAHNCILVDDPSETFIRYQDVISADGGQYFITTSTSAYPR